MERGNCGNPRPASQEAPSPSLRSHLWITSRVTREPGLSMGRHSHLHDVKAGSRPRGVRDRSEGPRLVSTSFDQHQKPVGPESNDSGRSSNAGPVDDAEDGSAGLVLGINHIIGLSPVIIASCLLPISEPFRQLSCVKDSPNVSHATSSTRSCTALP